MVLAPLIVFLVIALSIGLFCAHQLRRRRSNFMVEYFLGNRNLGAFSLALTSIATYGSVSSFVGGPGKASEIGFGWVYMASIQIVSLILLYGVLGSKIMLVSMRCEALSVPELLGKRFESIWVSRLAALIIIVFFTSIMVAQFVGGAMLFEAATGKPYVLGLVLFGVCSIAFTSLGGFRAVVFTDVLCALVMLLGIAVLGWGILSHAGGLASSVSYLKAHAPHFFDPFAHGKMPLQLYVSQWLLVGCFAFCLPQSVMRNLSFSSTQVLRRALMVGIIVMGLMMIGVSSLGVFAVGALGPEIAHELGSIDAVIPYAIVHLLPSWAVGIALVGPIAASISTVSSLLIMSANSLINDWWLQSRKSSPCAKRIAATSLTSSLVMGLAVIVLALSPPGVIWQINMFAFGGLESAFVWLLVCGLFSKRVNRVGALSSMIGASIIYCVAMAVNLPLAGFHPIVLGLVSGLVLMYGGSWLGARANVSVSQGVLDLFFPQRCTSQESFEDTHKPCAKI